ncbi:Ada metal-binding domain-containing protein, partial [Morganella morganii]
MSEFRTSARQASPIMQKKPNPSVAMNTQQQALYDALRARDRKFDGRFFVGVSSTGIYCRPVCSARTPKLENCT